MPLISLADVTLRFGGPPLLDGVDLHIYEGNRLCLLGRNGTGKSSMLRLVAGQIDHYEGSLAIGRETHIAYLEQEAPTGTSGTALEFCMQTASSEVNAEKYLTRLSVDPGAEYATLSGGNRRRVMLAATLAADADVLLLDEPTNHLDINATLWLEAHLAGNVRTFILVTHDRAFARAVSNRTAELDRGRLMILDCGLDEFLRRRDEQADAEARQQEVFDKKLAQEEAWLRRGTKARRTRDEGRVRALLRMREAYAERRSAEGQVRLRAQDAGRSGKLVAEATDVSFAYPSSIPDSQPRQIIRGLTTTIMRGDRVGVVGPNGAGKTTLVRLLLGELTPQDGTVRRGTNLEPLYFDQIREALREDQTVAEFLADGNDSVIVGGKQKHINAYLKDFLFTPDRARSPVGVLSGGERNRLMLAKLFLQPSNLLVMDEPTNDLDLDTLDLLEDMLIGYEGTLILVSHDRDLLDHVVTDCLVFLPDGSIAELAGGYSDWGHRLIKTTSAARGGGQTGNGGGPRSERTKPVARSGPRKLSFNEARELAALPEAIATLEEEIASLHETMADPELYRSEGERVAKLAAELEAKENELAEAFERWEVLDAIASAAES